MNETRRNPGSSIARNAVFNAIYKSLDILFPMISAGYAARILTPSGIGRNAIAQNNVSYFLVVATLGIYAYSIREISRCRGNRKKLDKLFSEILIINACLTVIAIVAFVIGVVFISSFKNDFILYLICGIVLLVNFANFNWFFQATEEYGYITLRSIAIKFLALIALFIFVRDQGDVYAFALVNSIAVCGHYLLNVFHARKTVGFTIKGLEIKKHLKPLFILALCCVSSELYARLDITMLGIMKDGTTVAFYIYSQRAVNLIVGFLIALTAVFLPRLSYFYTNDLDEFNRLTKIGVDLMILLSLPVCFGLASVAYPMISVWLGPDYIAAAPCLIVLAFIVPLKCIGDIACYQVMICAGQECVLMISYAMTLIVNLFANFLLIPHFGALGACLASLFSEMLVFIFVLIFAVKYQEYSIDRRNITVVMLSSVFMAVVVVIVETLMNNLILKLFASVLSGVFVFTVLNIFSQNHKMVKSYISELSKRKNIENS